MSWTAFLTLAIVLPELLCSKTKTYQFHKCDPNKQCVLLGALHEPRSHAAALFQEEKVGSAVDIAIDKVFRFAYCQCQLRSVFSLILRTFEWRHVTILVDEADYYSLSIGDSIEHGLRDPEIGQLKDDFVVQTWYFNSKSNYRNNYERMLQESSEHSRIFILSVAGDELRKCMLIAQKLNMTNGEWAFIDVELFRVRDGSLAWGNKHWKRGDSYDPLAQKAYAAFWPDKEDVNFFISSYHDATMELGKVLASRIKNGDDLNNGTAITRAMWGKSYRGVTGEFKMGTWGDRNADYVLKDLSPETGEFITVGHYYGDTSKFILDSSRPIHWPNNGKKPPDTPPCGFLGEKCKKKKENNQNGGGSAKTCFVHGWLVMCFACLLSVINF